MYIAVDAGGTNIKVASFDSPDEPKIKESVVLHSRNDYAGDLENMVQLIRKVGGENIEGIGVGLPGVLNEEKSCLRIAPHLTDWNEKPIKEDLQSQFKCTVILENDALAAALGEGLYGYGTRRDFLFIIWGTGIGGAAVHHTDGAIDITSFEPGHQIIEWKGQQHSCGQKGCLELFCSGAGIQEYYGKLPEKLTEEEWIEVTARFAQGLVNIIAIRPTGLIVFGGGVAVKQPLQVEQICLFVSTELKIFPAPEIKVTRYGENIGLYGAVSLLQRSQ